MWKMLNTYKVTSSAIIYPTSGYKPKYSAITLRNSRNSFWLEQANFRHFGWSKTESIIQWSYKPLINLLSTNPMRLYCVRFSNLISVRCYISKQSILTKDDVLLTFPGKHLLLDMGYTHKHDSKCVRDQSYNSNTKKTNIFLWILGCTHALFCGYWFMSSINDYCTTDIGHRLPPISPTQSNWCKVISTNLWHKERDKAGLFTQIV